MNIITHRTKRSALVLVHKAIIQDFNASEGKLIFDNISAFYDPEKAAYTKKLITWAIQTGTLNQMVGYLRARYGDTPAGLSPQDRDYFKRLFAAAPVSTIGAKAGDVLLDEYNRTQSARSLSLLNVKEPFDLQNALVRQRVTARAAWFSNNLNSTYLHSATHIIGDLMFEGVYGSLALPEYGGVDEFLTVTPTRAIVRDRKALSAFLHGRTDAQKLGFVVTETAQLLEPAAQDFWEFNPDIYSGVRWKHRWGFTGGVAPKGSDVRPNHVRMHNVTRPLKSKFNTFVNGNGFRMQVKGPFDPRMGPIDTVWCGCGTSPVLR